MKLAQVFAHAFVRKLAFVAAAALLGYCGMGKAQAQAQSTCAPAGIQWGCTYKDEAYAKAALGINGQGQNAAAFCAARSGIGPGSTFTVVEPTLNGAWEWRSQVECRNASGTLWGTYSPFYVSFHQVCFEGTWQESTKSCFTPEKCLAHNSEPGFLNVGAIAVSSTTQCVAGCEYKAVGPSVCSSIDGQVGQLCSADMDFTGNPCSSTPRPIAEAEADKDKAQECLPNGQVCIKPDGKHCYAASTGKQICWTPGETGEKAADNVAQKRDAGNQPIPPNLNLPNGDTLQQQGTPTTTTTTRTNGTTTTVITTTTTNYVTTNGTNAGENDSGEPADGSGGSGEGEGEGNGSSGGGDCSTPPVNTGDPLLSQIANQTWHTRCEAATRDSELRTEAAGLDTADGAAGHEGDVNSLWNEDSGGDYIADESGFGFGNTCPAPPEIAGKTLDWAGLCELMGMVGMLVIAAAHMHALYIIAGD